MQFDSISIEKKKKDPKQKRCISKEALDRPWVKCQVDLLITLHIRRARGGRREQTNKQKKPIKNIIWPICEKQKLLKGTVQ